MKSALLLCTQSLFYLCFVKMTKSTIWGKNDGIQEFICLLNFFIKVDRIIIVKLSLQQPIPVRGGVEDTRLEAKAKDTKKILGQRQGQPFRGQTLSRPRTGMLEAKAKDQGHKRKCSKKKVFSKKSFGGLQKKTFPKKFFKRSTKF